jgi:hypothetical protein
VRVALLYKMLVKGGADDLTLSNPLTEGGVGGDNTLPPGVDGDAGVGGPGQGGLWWSPCGLQGSK